MPQQGKSSPGWVFLYYFSFMLLPSAGFPPAQRSYPGSDRSPPLPGILILPLCHLPVCNGFSRNVNFRHSANTVDVYSFHVGKDKHIGNQVGYCAFQAIILTFQGAIFIDKRGCSQGLLVVSYSHGPAPPKPGDKTPQGVFCPLTGLIKKSRP